MGILAAVFFLTLAIWTIMWKGFALWVAAREESKSWFIALLILNTAGILEIIYIFCFSDWGKKYIAKYKASRKRKHSSHSHAEHEEN
jgi:hypothetical protein